MIKMNKFNPQLLKMLMSGNPQQIAMQMLQQNMGNNPMLTNLFNLASNGDGNGVTNMCKNILRSKGYDPDQVYQDFQNQLK